MGCDIHAYAERKNGDVWEDVGEIFEHVRSYALFGFLADVRNYSEVPPIAPQRGIPDDVSGDVQAAYENWDSDAHSSSWLSLAELLAFDYDQTTEDRRVTRQIGPRAWDGGCTAEPGDGKRTTFRAFLVDWYFAELERLKTIGAERIIFWFDN